MLERWLAAVVLVGGILLAATFWQSAGVPHELPPEEAVEAPPEERPRPPERAPVVEERDEDDDEDDDDRDRDREEKRKGKRGRGGDD